MELNYIENYQRVLEPITGDKGHADSGGFWNFKCPFPGCADSTKRKLRVNSKNGLWLCWRCQQSCHWLKYENANNPHGGRARDFVRLLWEECGIRDEAPELWPKGDVESLIPDKPKTTPTKARKVWSRLFELGTLSDTHRKYLIEKRGLDPDSLGAVSSTTALLNELQKEYTPKELEDARVFWYDDKGVGHSYLSAKPGRILIPYFGEKGEIRYYVGHFPILKPGDYHPVKYAAIRDFAKEIYGDIPQNSPFVIVTEGQLKAAAAIQKGFPTLGLAGMESQHTQLATLLNKKGVSRAIILFDTMAIKGDEEHAAEMCARVLLKKGIQPYVTWLPLEGKSKVDIDSYLLDHTAEEFAEILSGAKPLKIGLAPVEEVLEELDEEEEIDDPL